MREFAFELALCAALERETGEVVSRQLGASCQGNRVIDVVRVGPGPAFDARTAITPETIPDEAIASSVGVGRWRARADVLRGRPEWEHEAIDRAVEIGFFERERRAGRTCLRQVARYPDWFDEVVGIENKPDLDTPGDLDAQLRTDVSLGLFDRVVLATASYVTGAQLNRIPEAVGIWRYDPETGERVVVREATPLDPTDYGVEVVKGEPGRTDIEIVAPAEKARLRRRIAERAYGKGWRTYAFPACAQAEVGESARTASLPYCRWKRETVRPAVECGPGCPGHEPADAPAIDLDAERERRTPWVCDPDGEVRTQAGLDRFG